MTRADDYDFVHAIITTSLDAVVYCFWHGAKVIYQRWQASNEDAVSRDQLAVSIKYGHREKALLLMYKGRKTTLSAEEIQTIVGVDTAQKPFIKHILARGRSEVEQLLRTLAYTMNMSTLISYGSGEGIPDVSAVAPYYAPPAELDPSKWVKPSINPEEVRPPRFEEPTLLPRNLEVAFSQYANDLLCPYCDKLNVASEWPRHGDYVAFFGQTKERTEERPGAYRVKIHCVFCSRDWFVVWDQDPRLPRERALGE